MSDGTGTRETDTSGASAGSSARQDSEGEGVGEASGSTETGPRDGTDALGWRGWVLVAALVVSFLVIPWTIVLLPQAQEQLSSLGLGLRDAYLVLPMLPAVGLAVLAVWAAVANRREN